MGAGLLLRDGCSAALVGETMVQNPLMGKGGKRGGGMMTLTVVLTDQGEVRAIEAQAVRNVDVDATMGLDVRPST
jgi:redox-regulated HSP33 family molecular chaperone